MTHSNEKRKKKREKQKSKWKKKWLYSDKNIVKKHLHGSTAIFLFVHVRFCVSLTSISFALTCFFSSSSSNYILLTTCNICQHMSPLSVNPSHFHKKYHYKIGFCPQCLGHYDFNGTEDAVMLWWSWKLTFGSDILGKPKWINLEIIIPMKLYKNECRYIRVMRWYIPRINSSTHHVFQSLLCHFQVHPVE